MTSRVSGYLPNDRPPLGNIGYEGGFLPIKIPGLFPNGLPAIATAAVVGMVMNLVFTAFKPSPPPRVQPKAAIP